MNASVRLTALQRDLTTFNSDTAKFIQRYYEETELKTSLIFPLIQDRLKCKNGLRPIKKAYLVHVEHRLRNPGDPEHNHVADVLFAIRTVTENQYQNGIQSTIEDIDKLLEALPNYELERKEELECTLREAKAKLEKDEVIATFHDKL